MKYDESFLKILDIIGQHSTCDRGKVSALIAIEGRIISTGYAGSPPGLAHCDDEGHLYEYRSLFKPSSDTEELQMEFGLTKPHEVDGDFFSPMVWSTEEVSKHCIRTVHAEANAIAFAARNGTALEGATIYVKCTPCRDCAKLIIAAGIKRIVAAVDYHASKLSKDWFRDAGIELIIHSET